MMLFLQTNKVLQVCKLGGGPKNRSRFEVANWLYKEMPICNRFPPSFVQKMQMVRFEIKTNRML